MLLDFILGEMHHVSRNEMSLLHCDWPLSTISNAKNKC